MSYIVKGYKGNKIYKSKPFKTEEDALKFAYSKVYKKDGCKKRSLKNQLNSFEVAKEYTKSL
jgi:hypothetical protein